MIKQLFLSILFIFILMFSSFSQENVIQMGLMPIRVKISKKTQKYSLEDLIPNPKLNPNSLTEFEGRITPFLERELEKALKEKGILVSKVILNEDEIQEEEELYNRTINNYKAFNMENSKALFMNKAAKELKQNGELTQPVTYKYAKRIGRRYLLYYNFSGSHYQYKKNGDNLPLYPKGNLKALIFVVDGYTGLVVDFFQTSLYEESPAVSFGSSSSYRHVRKIIDEEELLRMTKRTTRETYKGMKRLIESLK